jgi:DNA/RNA endonuclease YhcR with UshA esterase domain
MKHVKWITLLSVMLVFVAGSSFAADVTFLVDMSVQTDNGTFDENVHDVVVRGDFNGWSGNDMMLIAGVSGIYSGTFDLAAANCGFKYVIVGGLEDVWETDIDNRQLVVDVEPVILDLVYFNDEFPPGETHPYEITFQVDMSVATSIGQFDPNTDGVVIRGDHANLGNWGGYTALAAAGDDIYAITINFDALEVGSVLEFKFVIDPDNDQTGTDIWEDLPMGGNRNYAPTGLEPDLGNDGDLDVTYGPVFFDDNDGAVYDATIAEVQTGVYVAGDVVRVTGIVTQGNMTCHDTYVDVFIQDASGYGIMLYAGDVLLGEGLDRGVEIEVVGEIEQYFDTTELMNWTFTVLSTDNPLPAPMTWNTGEFAEQVPFEGVWAELSGQLLDDPGLPGETFTLTVDDGTGEADVRIYGTVGLDLSMYSAGDDIIVRGTVDTYFGACQLQPSSPDDLGDSTPTATIAEVQTGVYVEGDVVRVTGVVTQGHNTVNTTRTDVFIQDDSGYGINVFDFDPLVGEGLDRGVEVEVIGEVAQYFDTTELVNFTFSVLSAGNPLPTPMTWDTGDFETQIPFEGVWAELTGELMTEPGLPENNYNVMLDDGTGEALVRIHAAAGLDLSALSVGDQVTFRGAVDVYMGTNQLHPSAPEDIEAVEGDPVTLNMTATSSSVPSAGGDIVYDATLTSFVGLSMPGLRFQTFATLPNNQVYGPIDDIPFNLTPFMNVTVSGRTIAVPGVAPEGSYILTGVAGVPNNPNQQVTDSFPFTKSGDGWNEDFEDGVAQDMTWSTGDLGSYVIEDGYAKVDLLAETDEWGSGVYTGEIFDVFTVSSTIEYVQSDDHSVGILLRGSGDVNTNYTGYAVFLNNGFWSAWVYNTPGVPTVLVVWTANGAITQGVGAVNNLQIDANETSFDVFCNGTYMGTVLDGSHASGYVGVVCEYESETWFDGIGATSTPVERVCSGPVDLGTPDMVMRDPKRDLTTDLAGFDTQKTGFDRSAEFTGTEYEFNPEDWAGAGSFIAADDIAVVELPTVFKMDSAYPNPFNAMATISVALPEAADLSVTVFNVTGQQVAELANGQFNAGQHNLTFDASNLASGLYFIRATVSGQLNTTQKVMLVR